MGRKSKPFVGVVLVGSRWESGYDEVWEILDDSAEYIGTVNEIERGELDESLGEEFTKKILKRIDNILSPRDEITNKEEKMRILGLIDKWFRENVDVPDDFSGYSDRADNLVVYKLIEYGR